MIGQQNEQTIQKIGFEFMTFVQGIYGRYLVMFVLVAFTEVIMITLIKAILGQGFRLTWLYGDNVYLNNFKDAEKTEFQRFRFVKKNKQGKALNKNG